MALPACGVNLALGIELQLKSLLLIQNKAARGHELDKLFNANPDNIIQWVEEAYISEGGGSEIEPSYIIEGKTEGNTAQKGREAKHNQYALQDLLKEHSEMFVQLRYIHEAGRETVDSFSIYYGNLKLFSNLIRKLAQDNISEEFKAKIGW